ncbi:MAG: hypothetical protein OES99_02665, partial [Gammaproteobacteria bacterium]|nr:hypothetical protein [Gammaproteobacteria bacterium]
NHLFTANGAAAGGAVAILDCDAIEFDNNTMVFNEASTFNGGGAFHIDTTSGSAPATRPMPDIYDNLFFGNIDQGGVNAYSINNLPAWGQGESHENLMDDAGSATAKDIVMIDHTMEFDVAYYLDQTTSSALNLSLTNANAASKFSATPNRTTDRLGAVDGGKADSAFHYEMLYLGDVVSVSTTSTLQGNNGPIGQSIRVGLYDAGSALVGSGYRVAFEVDAASAPVILKNPSDAQDPLVPVSHIIATDLGNGEYELVASTNGVPGPDTVTLRVYVDGLFIGTVVVPVL